MHIFSSLNFDLLQKFDDCDELEFEDELWFVPEDHEDVSDEELQPEKYSDSESDW